MKELQKPIRCHSGKLMMDVYSFTGGPVRSFMITMSLAAVQGVTAVGAQTGGVKPEFEVVSVRPNAACGGRSHGLTAPPSPGRLNLECTTAEDLIRLAYVILANGNKPHLRRVDIVGGPAWMRSDIYAVNAKAANDSSLTAMLGPMTRALLEDRFKLRVHHETKEESVYALTLAKTGFKLQPIKEGSCIPLDPDHMPPMPAPGQPVPSICGSQQMGRTHGKGVTIKVTGVTLADFGDTVLSGILGRRVIDKTGLTGRYDFELEFTPDEGMPVFQAPGRRGGDGEGMSATSEPDPPSILDTLYRLGLRIESAKGPVETLVVDNIERPSEN